MRPRERSPWIPLALAVLLLAVAAGPAGGKDRGKKKGKLIKKPGDLVVVFLPGEPLISIEHWRQGRMYLTYPDLEIGQYEAPEPEPNARQQRVRSIIGEDGKAVATYEVSENGRWLAVRYKKGPVQVTDLDSGETVLTVIENVSGEFALYPSQDRLLLFQPKIGITQWELELGERVGPTTPTGKAFIRYLGVAANGNYAKGGPCKAGRREFDNCIFDLRDGSTVAWANELGFVGTPEAYTERDRELADEYKELLVATGFAGDVRWQEELAARPPAGCRRLSGNRLFCCGVAVAMIDESSAPVEPVPPPASERTARGLLDMAKTASEEMPGEWPGRYLWKIAPNERRKRMFVNSCDLSADERWVVLGVDSREVLLFTTEELEEATIWWTQPWRQPVLVGSYPLP